MLYINRFVKNSSNKVYAYYYAEDVIHDKVMYKDDYYHEPRSIEDQIEQCVKIMGKLIEHLGIDASIFNDDFIKDE